MENKRNMSDESERNNRGGEFQETEDRVNERRNGSRGGYGGGGFHGHGGAPGQMLKGRLGGDETAILVFVGSLNCIRHKPYMRIGEMMQEGKAALLCPSMSDFSSGRYLNQIVDAIVELSKERGTKHFVLTYGCQWVILSTDGELLTEQLKGEYDIDLKLWEDSHLEFGDHE
ncbi:MAG: hypothetical protein LUC95_04370 [Lachnospiraceae bacterium]|nr:hypothetical protein [Lachnospiraceae bacterium]